MEYLGSRRRHEKLRGTIDGKDDFTEFAKEFEYSQVLLMRSWLVPNYEILRMGI